jgi:hypothetical protein
MTTPTRDKEQLTQQLRTEAAHVKAAAHDAIDDSDPALAIALLKTLRSVQWRANGFGIDLGESETEISDQG